MTKFLRGRGWVFVVEILWVVMVVALLGLCGARLFGQTLLPPTTNRPSSRTLGSSGGGFASGDNHVLVGTNGVVNWPTNFWEVNYTNLASPNAATLWVDPGGDDATAVRGQRDRPWKRPDFALTNALVGDTVWLMPGSYVMSNACRLPTNGCVKGSGQAATIIRNYSTNSGNIPIPLFSLADNSRLADLTIYVGHMGQVRYQSAYGVHRATRGAYSNAIVENVTADGETDTFYIDHSNRTHTILINPRIPTNGWDLVALKNGAHRVDIFNPYMVSTNVSVVIANQNHFLNLENSAGSIVNVYGGYIRVGNSGGRIVSSIGAGVDARFYNTVLTNAATTWFNLSTTDALTLQGTYAPPTGIALDSAAPMDLIPVLTTNITWGGDAEHGSGPVMVYGGTLVGLNTTFGATKLYGTNGVSLSQSNYVTAANARTMHTFAGKVKIASGSQDYVVTDSNVANTSLAWATVNTTNGTAVSCQAFPGTGFLALKLNASATADCDVTWWIMNP